MLMLQNLLLGVRADAGLTMARARRTAILGAVAALLLLTAYVAGTVALAILIARTEGAVLAAMMVALINLVLGVAVIAYVLVRNRQDRRRQLATIVQLQALSQQAGASAALGLLQKRPVGGLMAVTVGAFVLTKLLRR